MKYRIREVELKDGTTYIVEDYGEHGFNPGLFIQHPRWNELYRSHSLGDAKVFVESRRPPVEKVVAEYEF